MTDRPAPLDAVDLEMVRILRDDGRISITRLAEQVHVSRASAYARLERLRRDGVIRGFSATVDAARLGLGVTAVVLLSAGRSGRFRWREFGKRLAEMPEVESAYLVTGEADIVVVVRTSDNEGLRGLLLERLQGLPHVTDTVTLLVLDEVVRRPYVLP
ncbi:MAG TPA: Lrp/AsnC family transcriptional regulator [Jiangellales bacterium]|nr:Lrp/AsnC family transcriptional regulator [Jiangellales bacterium]